MHNSTANDYAKIVHPPHARVERGAAANHPPGTIREGWFANQALPETSGYGISISERAKKAVDINTDDLIKVSAVFGRGNALPILDESNLCRVRSFGLAVGEPHSKERLSHLERIWGSNVPELRLIDSHREEMKGVWIDNLAGLRQGQSLFLRIVAQSPESQYLQALLGDSRPHWLMDGQRPVNLDELVHDGFIRCGLWIQRRSLKNSSTFYPSPFVTAKEMQRFPVGIKDDGCFQV